MSARDSVHNNGIQREAKTCRADDELKFVCSGKSTTVPEVANVPKAAEPIAAASVATAATAALTADAVDVVEIKMSV